MQVIPRPPSWQLADPAHWVRESPHPLSTSEVIHAVQRISARPPLIDLDDVNARPSAVAVVLSDGPNGAEVLLTRRAQRLRNHAGEISFPGGRMDPGETPQQTALREAAEEVDLHPTAVAIRGQLSPLSTFVSRSYIVPVVAELSTDQRPLLRAAANEVERILWVPLADLARADTYRHERWPIQTEELSFYFFELDDETIWGATGRILHQLLDIAYGPPATLTAL